MRMARLSLRSAAAFRALAVLAAPLLLAACDAGAPDDARSLTLPDPEAAAPSEARCGGEDAVALRARAHLLRRDDGGVALTLDLVVAQRGEAGHGTCEVALLVPLHTDALQPGRYEVPVTDRNVLVVERDGADALRFAPLTGRLRIDRVSDDAVSGFLAVGAVTDRGTATASATFRAPLGR